MICRTFGVLDDWGFPVAIQHDWSLKIKVATLDCMNRFPEDFSGNRDSLSFFCDKITEVFRQYMKNIELFALKQCFEFIHRYDRNRDNLFCTGVIPRNLHFIKRFKEHFQLIHNKLMCEDKPLIIRPKFSYPFNKIIRIIPFNDVFEMNSNVEIDKLTNIMTNFLVDKDSLV